MSWLLTTLLLGHPGGRPMQQGGPGTFSGIAGQTAVPIPRIEAGITVDGLLDEPVWQSAALLTGFSQYSPVDGRPAEDSTEVLVWYSGSAIYFGIRAFEPHGAVHATLADRDHIDADDWVELLLDTYHQSQQALVFGVNPLGVQSDGTLSEIGIASVSGHAAGAARTTVDLSADFVYQSKGRVTPDGYEVEVRIPFKSLPYQSGAVQTWGINIIRLVQHSGYQDTWTKTRLSAASFLAQGGTLTGITDLHRGLVLDLTPEVTGKADGAPQTSGAWGYTRSGPELGATARWGITNNLTLNATANPDFSQVEADASQLVFDPRQALFYPEKRPFFLDGLEQFSTPSTLIYTRQIVQPDAALKLTGNVGGTSLGVLSAVDQQASSVSGTENPIFNILRVRRGTGGESTAGIVYTDRIEGADYNRVAGADARLVLGRIYTVAVQAAASFTRVAGTSTDGPLWNASVQRSGHRYGFTYQVSAIHPDFVAASGFISRAGITTATIDNNLTWYGHSGATIESWTADLFLFGRWDYERFVHGQSATDRELHVNSSWVLRGGWNVTAGVFFESFGYDSSLYAGYALQHTSGGVTDTVPFTGTPHIPNLDIWLQLQTPQFRRFTGNVLLVPAIQDENFYEWSPAKILITQVGVLWRPSDQLRFDGSFQSQQYWRKSDGSLVAESFIPRLKVEYQLSRPLFFRVVGQYVSQHQDSLRDDSRTNDPILIKNPDTGIYELAVAKSSNTLRVDWLASYKPTPGTVIFFGYGSSMDATETLSFKGLQRTSDGFFLKLSYLFRL